MNTGPDTLSNAIPSPLWLLIRTNGIGLWRKMISMRERSMLLVLSVVAFLGFYLALAFTLFYRGLEFIGRFPGLGGLLVERLLFLLFAFLFALLLLSNLVIGYTNLFKNRETAFLLSLPIPANTIFRWKFMESVLLASWAFLFLIAPLLAAYGITRHVPWHFYPATVGLVLLFIALPGVAGGWGAVLLARHLDRKAFQLLALALLAAVIGGLALYFRPTQVTDEFLENRVLTVIDRLLERTRFAQFPFLPSYWLSSSVQNWSEGSFSTALFFALVLLSHVCFFGFLSFTRMGDRFYDAVSITQSRGSALAGWSWFRRWRQSQKGRRDMGGFLESALAPLKPDVRAIVIKDLRVFWRDTAQWGQTAVLFGLLLVYVINLRNFSQQLDSPFWRNLVSFLNLGACSLNLATLTTRFVFPQFSLEGKRVWLIGLAPIGLVRSVKVKFWLAATTTLLITLPLILLSSWMLQLGAVRTVYFVAATACMTYTLNAMAVGLGALYPNFRENNPSKIVNGFGGTFCLVLSFVYILSSVVLLAVWAPWAWRTGELFIPRALAATTGFLLLSALAGWLPYFLGLRRVAQTEL